MNRLRSRWIALAAIAGFILLIQPASAEDAFAYYGDHLVEPGKRLGKLLLGMTREEVSSLLQPAQAEDFQGGDESQSGGRLAPWPFRWTAVVTGLVEIWPKRALIAGFCESNKRMFLVMGYWIRPADPASSLLNPHTVQLKPVGRSGQMWVGMSTEQATARFGQPVHTVWGMMLENARTYLFGNGLAFVFPGATFGAYNFAVCQQ